MSPPAARAERIDVTGGGDASALRGRPRDADRTAAILDAAADVMHDIGWDGFTVQEVANRASAGLATIYRRWPTKEDLVAAAMRHDMRDGFGPIPNGEGTDAGDPRDELVNTLTLLGDKMCGNGGSIISVLAAARDHPAMRDALDEVMRDAVRASLIDRVRQLLGSSHPLAVTLVDSMLGALIFRAGLLEDETAGAAFAAEMVGLLDAVATSADGVQ